MKKPVSMVNMGCLSICSSCFLSVPLGSCSIVQCCVSLETLFVCLLVA